MTTSHRLQQVINLLQKLIATPSPSRDESDTADIWQDWLAKNGAPEVSRYKNNIYAVAPGYNSERPTLLLNSHHDTVKPASGYSRQPYSADIEGDRLFGLGSNDAGASGVTLAATYLDLRNKSLPFNLILAITAEEEVGGENGMRAFLPHLSEQGYNIDMAIVGEPTGMQPAVAERGLVVLDCETHGRSGHAARNEGINAIYLAISDIERIRQFRPEHQSAVLGPINTAVTMINAGSQHNVVPDLCKYVVDVRTTDAYSNEQTVELLRNIVQHSTLTPRSTRVRASVIDTGHPLVQSALRLGLQPFVSPTTSDMSLMHNIDSLKIGPGQSSRSHAADEYILISEIDRALRLYPKIIEGINV